MYTVKIYQGRLGMTCEVDFRFVEKVSEFIKIIKWNGSMEIYVEYQGDLKYYVKYEEELEMLLDALSK